jgi:hypothetical protein
VKDNQGFSYAEKTSRRRSSNELPTWRGGK